MSQISSRGGTPIPPGTYVQTLTGDTGGAVGPDLSGNINVITNVASNRGGASVSFVGNPGTNTVQLFTTDGNFNTSIGWFSGNPATTGNSNTSLGFQVLSQVTTGLHNTAIGASSSFGIMTGQSNTALGYESLLNVSSGSNNLALGVDSANNYNGAESNNICIGNNGVTGESNVIRIGTQGSGAFQQDECYVAGITGVSVSNQLAVVIDSITNQLGTIAVPSSGLSTLTTDGGAVATESLGNINLITGQLNGGVGDSLTATASGDTLTIGLGEQIFMPNSGSSTGLYFMGSSVFMHNFSPGGSPRSVFVGNSAGNQTASGGLANVGLGSSALTGLVSGSSNVAVGTNCMSALTSGSNNIALGLSAGSSYTTESSNISLSNTGIAAESNTIRIGTQGSGTGQQNRNFQAGIAGVSISNSAPVVIDTTTGQLGTVGTFVDWTSWTPTITGFSTAGTTTYTLQVGLYSRIGNVVFAQFCVTYTAATGTGAMTLGGLPLTISNTANYNPTGTITLSSAGTAWPASVTHLTLVGLLNTTTALIQGNGSSIAAANVQMANTSATLCGTLIYRV